MKFGLCVLGCGAFARAFARAIQGELEHTDLYFASRDASRAAAFAAEYCGADSFGSYESAVADSRVEAVYVCTPPPPPSGARPPGRQRGQTHPLGEAPSPHRPRSAGQLSP